MARNVAELFCGYGDVFVGGKQTSTPCTLRNGSNSLQSSGESVHKINIWVLV